MKERMNDWINKWRIELIGEGMKGLMNEGWQVGTVQGFDWIEVSPISLHRSQN